MSETLAPFAAFIDKHYGGTENYESEPSSVVRAVRAAFLAGYRAGIAAKNDAAGSVVLAVDPSRSTPNEAAAVRSPTPEGPPE